MRGFQKAGEASGPPSSLLFSGPSMASRVFKGNKKLLDSSRSWSWLSLWPSVICTQEAGKEKEGKDVTSGTEGTCPLALDSQEQKRDLQKPAPAAACPQPSQWEQAVCLPSKAGKVSPLLSCQASVQ